MKLLTLFKQLKKGGGGVSLIYMCMLNEQYFMSEKNYWD